MNLQYILFSFRKKWGWVYIVFECLRTSNEIWLPVREIADKTVFAFRILSAFCWFSWMFLRFFVCKIHTHIQFRIYCILFYFTCKEHNQWLAFCSRRSISWVFLDTTDSVCVCEKVLRKGCRNRREEAYHQWKLTIFLHLTHSSLRQESRKLCIFSFIDLSIDYFFIKNELNFNLGSMNRKYFFKCHDWELNKFELRTKNTLCLNLILWNN